MYKFIHMLRNWSEQYPCIYLSRRIIQPYMEILRYVRTYNVSVSPYKYPSVYVRTYCTYCVLSFIISLCLIVIDVVVLSFDAF